MASARRRTTGRSQPAGLSGSILQEARQAGLLDDEIDHVSFRAPRALIEAAKKETCSGGASQRNGALSSATGRSISSSRLHR
jgi:hypothetical protein